MEARLFESLTSDLNIHHHSDWVVFDNRLESAIRAGRARKIQKTRTIYAPSEEWYLDPANGDIYVYLRPDDRVLPEWTKVDLFAKPEVKETNPKDMTISGLSAIPTGETDQIRGRSLKYLLQRMAEHGEIEVVTNPTPGVAITEGALEVVFREVRTGLLYRLVEYPEGQKFLWERISSSPEHLYVQ